MTETSSPASDRGPILVQVFGRTDVGRTREHNEDAFVVADLTAGNATLQPDVRAHVCGPRGTLFMAADGMGGAAAGEIASAMAVEVVVRDLLMSVSGPGEATPPDAFVAAMRAATDHANARIHRYAIEHPEYRGMGTTATVAGLLGDTLYCAQVGDSRAYLVRDGAARQITKDQSLMQRLVEAGEITAEEAEVSDRRNIILQALGPEGSIKIDLTHQRVCRGDTLILCSDGLSGLVRPEEFARAVQEEPDLVALCKRLIDAANTAGGPDNITVIAARLDGEGLELPGAEDAVGYQVYQTDAEADAVTLEVPAARLTMPRTISGAFRAATGVEDEAVAGAPRSRASVRRAYLSVAILAVLLAVLFGLYHFDGR